jgi:predicted nucleotide-binding protein (sugar kinase/HSP70/actin superfamily)
MKTEKDKKTKFAFYQFGHSVMATDAFAKNIGIETIQIEYPNKDTINRGIMYAPEFSCFPFKIVLGILLQAMDRGAEVFVIPIFRSITACQAADFGIAHKYILQKTGKDFEVILLDSMNPAAILKKFKKYVPDITLKKVSEGLLLAAQKLSLMEEVDEYYRKIYLSTDKRRAESFMTKWRKIITNTSSVIELYLMHNHLRNDYKRYPDIDMKNILKIAVIGDIYTLNEPFINNNIFERLCDLGVYPEQGIRWSEAFEIPIHITPEDIALMNETKKYMRHNVGTYAQDTIKDAIRYAEKGYDGIIQIYPFNCMPEITARNILPKISTDYKTPILYLPVDEQTGDAGFTTRIEAFVDLINIRRNKDNFASIQTAGGVK